MSDKQPDQRGASDDPARKRYRIMLTDAEAEAFGRGRLRPI